MGADLRIVKEPDSEKNYFRDAYNETNIFWRLGLSWWQPPYKYNKDNNLSAAKVKKLLELVKSRKTILDKFLETELSESWLKSNNCSIEDGGVEGWRTYYSEKYNRFVTYLEHAVELNSEIHCSV
jgi:hypothetical protein